MKKLSFVIFILSLLTLSGCHHWHGHGNSNGGHCPPGQAKKGNC